MKCPQAKPLLWLFTNLTKLLVSKIKLISFFLGGGGGAFPNVNSAKGYDFVRTKFIGYPTKEVTLISTLNFLFKLGTIGSHLASDSEDLRTIPQQSWS